MTYRLVWDDDDHHHDGHYTINIADDLNAFATKYPTAIFVRFRPEGHDDHYRYLAIEVKVPTDAHGNVIDRDSHTRPT